MTVFGVLLDQCRHTFNYYYYSIIVHAVAAACDRGCSANNWCTGRKVTEGAVVHIHSVWVEVFAGSLCYVSARLLYCSVFVPLLQLKKALLAPNCFAH